MNDTPSPDGSTGGYSAPLPDNDFQPLEIEVDSVASFGAALVAEADHIGDSAGAIKADLKDPASLERGAAYGSPFARDPRQEALHQIAVKHTQSMDDMSGYIDNVQAGIRNLGLISQRITAAYTNQDELNAADQNDVIALIKGDDPRPGQQEV